MVHPERNRRALYNERIKVHEINFQLVAAPNRLSAELFGPIEGRRQDSTILARSGFLQTLEHYSIVRDKSILCIYDHPALPLRPQLQKPFCPLQTTLLQSNWNKGMSSVRVSGEWAFRDVINYYKFFAFRKKYKIQLSAVGKMYIIWASIRNARSCFYRNSTSSFFDCTPSSIQEYFQQWNEWIKCIKFDWIALNFIEIDFFIEIKLLEITYYFLICMIITCQSVCLHFMWWKYIK